MLALAAILLAAAPTATAPPTISGTPAWGSTLTCNNGTWSADATGFEYAWAYSGGGTVVATGQTWKVNAALSNRVVCTVTARDGAGQAATATSAPVVIGPGVTELSLIAEKTQRKKAVVITGKVGPGDANVDPKRRTSVTVYRDNGASLTQLTFSLLAKPDGTFRARFADSKGGRATYQVQVTPADQRWQTTKKQIKVRLRR